MKLNIKLKPNWRKHIKHIYLAASLSAFGIGGTIAYLGNQSENPLLILIGFGGLAGGFLLLLSRRKLGDIRLIGKAKRKDGEDFVIPNSLNIYKDKVIFEYVNEPLGQSQKNYNDGQYYHVHEINGDGELKEFELPDDDDRERYYDPGEFANPVTMPSNKKYFTWAASTIQKVSIGLMALVIGAELIGLIALGG